MNSQNWILLYFIIGIVYVIVNGLFRKMDTDGNPMLVWVWLTLWPVCFVPLAYTLFRDHIFIKLKKKYYN